MKDKSTLLCVTYFVLKYTAKHARFQYLYQAWNISFSHTQVRSEEISAFFALESVPTLLSLCIITRYARKRKRLRRPLDAYFTYIS